MIETALESGSDFVGILGASAVTAGSWKLLSPGADKYGRFDALLSFFKVANSGRFVRNEISLSLYLCSQLVRS